MISTSELLFGPNSACELHSASHLEFETIENKTLLSVLLTAMGSNWALLTCVFLPKKNLSWKH